MTVPVAGRGRALLWAVAAAGVSAVFVAPLVLVLLGSLRRPGLPPPDGLELWPQPFWAENFADVWTLVPLARQLGNSLLVIGVAVPVTVLVASWAGFALVAGGRRVRAVVLVGSLVALAVPASALWVPRVVLFERLGLTDLTIAPAATALLGTSPFLVLLLALATYRVPRTLLEAAAVEGLSGWRTWRTVVVPLTRPALVAVAVLAFVAHWSNLVEPLLLLADEGRWPVALGLRTLAAYEPTFYPLLLAASVLAVLPPLVAFALAQRALFERTLGQ